MRDAFDICVYSLIIFVFQCCIFSVVLVRVHSNALKIINCKQIKTGRLFILTIVDVTVLAT